MWQSHYMSIAGRLPQRTAPSSLAHDRLCLKGRKLGPRASSAPVGAEADAGWQAAGQGSSPDRRNAILPTLGSVTVT